MAGFADAITAFNRKYEARLRATAREAVQETLALALRTRGEGGRLRVDTGFLRASIQAAIGQMPSGPTTNESNQTFSAGEQVAGEPISVTLLRWNPNKGDTFFAGFTAEYARARESKDGFLRGATELWKDTVNKAAVKVRASLG